MSLRSLLLSLLVALAAARQAEHSYRDDPDISIGVRQPISDDRRSIKGWRIIGSPQILSDRVILTPGSPGNQRVGLWTENPNPYDEFSVSMDFRTGGLERAGGSLHFWYTMRGSQSGSGSGTDTIYTSKPWDGLALVVDSYEGGTGTLRAYLNDGQTDYSQHHKPASLAFGHCDFHYRNRGIKSNIRLVQSGKSLRVETDGRLCFETDKAHLPKNYYFGVTAVTSDPPDSFELFGLIISGYGGASGSSIKPPTHQDAPAGRMDSKPPKQPDLHAQYPDDWITEPGEEDHEANYYKTQDEQFTDLHNRLQGLTHHLAAIQYQIQSVFEKVDKVNAKQDDLLVEARKNEKDAMDRVEARLQALETLSIDIANVVTHKDYSHHFDKIHAALKEHQANMLYAVPATVSHVITNGAPRMGMAIGILVAVQIALAAAYVVYKRRRNSSPKKYL